MSICRHHRLPSASARRVDWSFPWSSGVSWGWKTAASSRPANGRRLILEPRDEVLRRVRGRFALVPDEVGLTDELLADRRAESAREDAE